MRISRAQPIFSGKKRRHDAHSVETLYIFTPPQSVCNNIRTPAWKQGNCIWERGNPLYARQSLAYLQTSHFPQHRLGLPPQDPALGGSLRSLPHYRVFLRKTRAVLAFKSAFAPCLVRSQLSKVFSLLPQCVFGFRGHSQSLARLVFVLRDCSRGFPGTFSAFGSIPTTSTAHFQTSGAFPRLPRRISGLREHSQGFHGVFSAFGSVPSQRSALLTEFSCGKLAQFQPSGAFRRSALHCFVFRGGCPNAHTGIVRAWRGNHTKSFHQEDEPWQRRQLQR